MAEEIEQPEEGGEAGGQQPEEPRTFTQDEVNRLLGRERAKYKGFSDLKKKAQAYEELKASQMSEEERQAKTIADLKAENERYRAAESKRRWVADVSKETGVPADVLGLFDAESAEDLKAKAELVSDRFKKETVPVVPGDGIKPEISGGGKRDFLRETLPANLRR